jgi:hypothetical protein
MGREGLKLRWTHPALADLVEAQNYITRGNHRLLESPHNMSETLSELF